MEANEALANSVLVLVDKQNGVVSDLRTTSKYEFTTLEKNMADRFEIRIMPANQNQLMTGAKMESIQMVNNGSAYQLLFNFNEQNNVKIELLNSIGQVIRTEQLSQVEKGSHLIQHHELSHGSYLIRVTGKNEIKVFKTNK